VRAFSPAPFSYERVILSTYNPTLANLLSIQWLLLRTGAPVPPGMTNAGRVGRFTLYRRLNAAPRASLLGTWSSAPEPGVALAYIRRPGFDPDATAVVEHTTGSGRLAAVGTARYHSTGSGSASVAVSSPRPQLLLIRTPYASGWKATVNGHAVPVLPADYVDQGVMVPAGRSVVELEFTDPWVMRGVYLSLAAVVALLGAAAVAAAGGRRQTADEL
jgi:hypothetical protein